MFKTIKSKTSKKGKVQLPEELFKLMGKHHSYSMSYDEEDEIIIIATSKDRKKRKAAIKKYTNNSNKKEDETSSATIGKPVQYKDFKEGLFLYNDQLFIKYSKLVTATNKKSYMKSSSVRMFEEGSTPSTFKNIRVKELTISGDKRYITKEDIDNTIIYPVTLNLISKNLNKGESIDYEEKLQSKITEFNKLTERKSEKELLSATAEK